MPYLGDFLGQLVSEVTLARLHADLETVRLAELYAGHELLRHMPVPHFRLPDVDIEVPVIIKEAPSPPAGMSPRGGATLPAMRASFDGALDGVLVQNNISLTADQRKRLKTELDERAKVLEQPSETAVGVHHVADELAEVAMRVIANSREPGALTPLPPVDAVKQVARQELQKLRQPPPRLMTLVTSSEIREAGGGENVTRLRLKISERGVEWANVESADGSAKGRLVPE